MKIIKTKFKELLIFESKNFIDNRGYFRELSIEKIVKKKLVFTVVSKSKKMFYVDYICRKIICKESTFQL